MEELQCALPSYYWSRRDSKLTPPLYLLPASILGKTIVFNFSLSFNFAHFSDFYYFFNTLHWRPNPVRINQSSGNSGINLSIHPSVYALHPFNAQFIHQFKLYIHPISNPAFNTKFIHYCMFYIHPILNSSISVCFTSMQHSIHLFNTQFIHQCMLNHHPSASLHSILNSSISVHIILNALSIKTSINGHTILFALSIHLSINVHI